MTYKSTIESLKWFVLYWTESIKKLFISKLVTIDSPDNLILPEKICKRTNNSQFNSTKNGIVNTLCLTVKWIILSLKVDDWGLPIQMRIDKEHLVLQLLSKNEANARVTIIKFLNTLLYWHWNNNNIIGWKDAILVIGTVIY